MQDHTPFQHPSAAEPKAQPERDEAEDPSLAPPLDPASEPDEGDNARILHARLTGSRERTQTVLAGLEDIPGVDDILRMDIDARIGREDVSSAGLPDDNPSSLDEIEIRVARERVRDDVQQYIEQKALEAGVAVEWLDRF